MPSRRLRPTLKGNPGIGFGPGFLERRPLVAALVMQLIAEWSEVELQRSRLLTVLLGNSEAALDMYLALTSSVAQKAALRAVLASSVSPDELSLFERIMKFAAPIESDRNEYAHWLWGTSDQIDDGLLCMSPAYRIRHMAQNEAAIARGERPKGIDFKEVFLVKSSDLMESIKQVRRVHNLLYRFVGLCGMRKGPERDAQRIALEAEPETRKR